MYHSESLIVRVLSIAGTVVGLATGLITLYGFVVSNGSLLNWFGVETFGDLAAWARSFGERWTFGPFLSALIIYGIVAAVVFFSDRWDDAAEYLGTILLLFPLPAIWIWLFSDVVSVTWLIVFLIGYSAVPWLSLFVPSIAAFVISERFERRRSISGTVREVTAKDRMLLGRKHTVYTLIVDREADVPVKARYSPWWDEKSPIKRGASVRVFGRWQEGVFFANRIEAVSAAEVCESAETKIPG
jgi:hypothetical protein